MSSKFQNKEKYIPAHKRNIGKKRYLDSRENKISNKGDETKDRKKGINKQIRDLKRYIDHIGDSAINQEKKPENEQILESQKDKLKKLVGNKRKNRAEIFIDKKYKNIKFYGTYLDLYIKETKKLNKMLERLDKADPEFQNKRNEILDKINYITVFL